VLGITYSLVARLICASILLWSSAWTRPL
jgi:hypothetical protein